MANRIPNPKVYANVMLKLLRNNLVMGRMVSSTHKDKFKKVGDTIYVKRPPQYVIRQGKVAQVQDTVVGEQPVRLDYQCGVDIEYDSVEETLDVDELLEDETMQSVSATLAQEIDSCLMMAVLEFPNWVGTPGQTIDSPEDFFLAPERLDDLAIPQNLRNGVLSTRDYWKLAAFFTSATQSADNEVNKTALQKAQLPMVGGVNPYQTQSVINLTTGTRTAGVVDGAGQEVDYLDVADDYEQELDIKGIGSNATISAGEVFTIDGVYAVNPRTKAKMDFLYQMVVLEDAKANSSGEVTLRIANPMIVSGAYQTVDAAPENNAVVTFLGSASSTYRQNAVFHKHAIQLASAKLVRPRSGKFSYATDKETGISIRYWETSDGVNDTHLRRWDVLFGVTNVDRRLGVRVSGTASPQ